VPAASYDSIISIGAFEHVCAPIQRVVRVQGYRDFFERCYGWLNPGGWMSLQTIGLGSVDRGVEGQFVAENIFPESDLPRLGEIADSSEGIFEVVSIRNDRADYKRTNHEFRDRLRKNRDAAVSLVGEETVRTFDKYSRVSAASAAARPTFIELPFGDLSTRVSISLCDPKHVAGSFRSAGNGFPLAKHAWPSSTGDRNEIVTIEFDRFVSCALSTRLPDQVPTADALILFPTAFAPQSRGIFFSPIESYRVKAHVCASIPSDL
jgi:hypothetical protein